VKYNTNPLGLYRVVKRCLEEEVKIAQEQQVANWLERRRQRHA